MSNDITKKSEVQLDAFSAGYSEPARTGDAAGGSSGGVGFGIKIKFTKEARWVDPDDNDVTGPLLALDVLNRVQKWPGDGGGPLETITLKPGEDWPDIDALNENCRDEWFEKFGKIVGPWAGEHVVLFVDPANMTAYWWPSPTATIGACVAVSTLMKQTKLMRQLKQQPVHPLVEPTHTFMKTQFGGHERPMLKIVNWVVLGGSGGGGVLPPANSPPLAGGASNPTPFASNPVQSGAPLAMRIVTPPTVKEELADEIPY